MFGLRSFRWQLEHDSARLIGNVVSLIKEANGSIVEDIVLSS